MVRHTRRYGGQAYGFDFVYFHTCTPYVSPIATRAMHSIKDKGVM